ncbi:MAG: hypothetical protein ACEQSC_00780, partial [Candidatus Nanopelagicaceae bacterium]
MGLLIFGEVHLKVAITVNNLAVLYSNLNRHEDAQIPLSISEILLDRENREICTAISNLGKCYNRHIELI